MTEEKEGVMYHGEAQRAGAGAPSAGGMEEGGNGGGEEGCGGESRAEGAGMEGAGALNGTQGMQGIPMGGMGQQQAPVMAQGAAPAQGPVMASVAAHPQGAMYQQRPPLQQPVPTMQPMAAHPQGPVYQQGPPMQQPVLAMQSGYGTPQAVVQQQGPVQQYGQMPQPVPSMQQGRAMQDGPHVPTGQVMRGQGQAMPGMQVPSGGSVPHGRPETRDPEHDMHRYGQLFEVVNDIMNGNPEPAKILRFIDGFETQFWKGAMLGVGVTLLVTNDTVKKKFVGGVAGLWSKIQKDAEVS